MKIILASGSPRRREILSELGYEFEIAVADVIEDIIPGESPENHVLRLSRRKAEKVAVDHPGDMVVGADTAVVLEGEILGKPRSGNDAVEMLKKLSAKTHTVYTGLAIALRSDNIVRSGFDKTEVTFNSLTEDRIRDYVKTGEPLDKAGSYGIQGMGSFLVEYYTGELDTVIGFPSRLFERMYKEVVSCLNR